MKKRDVVNFPYRAKSREQFAFPMVFYLQQEKPETLVVMITQVSLAHIMLIQRRYVSARTKKQRLRALHMLTLETLRVLHAMKARALIEKGLLIPVVDEIRIRGRGWSSKASVLRIVTNHVPYARNHHKEESVA